MKHASKSPRRRTVSRSEKRAITAICIALAVIMLALGSYAAGWYANRARIRDSAERYRAMYNPGPTPTANPGMPGPTSASAPTPEPTPADTDDADPSTVGPLDITQPVAVDELLPTPNAETRVYTLPSAPPVQPTFSELLAHNPDTVGYLDIEGLMSLPVVQRENDNAYYLTHNFDGRESPEGALFLDGVNRLVPEDECLIVYGHNMKNDTMFGRLDDYEELKFVKQHGVVRFDTLYENRVYTPFAAFTASMDPADRHYFDVRQFTFDDTGFELFTLKMQSRSARRFPVDVRRGDRLLLLVTCDYGNREGRFILGLRQLRHDETEASVRELFEQMK